MGPSAPDSTFTSACGEGLYGAEQSAGRSDEEERDPAAFELALARLSATVSQAAGRQGSWLERLRAGLVAFLGFFDDEPGWGRLLASEAPVRDATLALRCEQRVRGVLTGLLDDGSPQAMGESMPCPELTSELAIGGVMSVVRARMHRRDREALVGLAPELMSLIVLPYLGQAAASAELTGTPAPAGEASWGGAEPRDERLPMRATHRTMLVLRAIEAAPCSSNRQVMAAADLLDEGQASKLLSRLSERGVIENLAHGAEWGEPNAWRLTAEGERVLRLTGGVPRTGSPRRRGDGTREGHAR